MLHAANLTFWRGNTCLFRNLSFQVAPGAALVVRGPNGVGKTSLLRVLCGLTRADAGQVHWAGQPAETALRGQVAYAGHQPALKADLTVRQNLAFCAQLAPHRDDWVAVLDELQLNRCAELEVRHLSAGQRRRAALARVVMSTAPVWLLDEPFTNVDQEGQRVIERCIDRHLSRGGLAVIVSHGELRLDTGRVATMQMASE